MDTGDIMRRRAICVSIDKKLVEELDKLKKNLSRSAYIETTLLNALGMQ